MNNIENSNPENLQNSQEKKDASKLLQELLNSDIYKKISEEMEKNPIKEITREELLQQRKNEEKMRIQTEIAFGIIFIIAAIAGMAGSDSTSLLIILSLFAGIAGYYATEETPMSGIFGSMVFVIASGYAFDFYLSGRTNYIRIELLIPFFMAAIPAGIIFFGLFMVEYSNKK